MSILRIILILMVVPMLSWAETTDSLADTANGANHPNGIRVLPKVLKWGQKQQAKRVRVANAKTKTSLTIVRSGIGNVTIPPVSTDKATQIKRLLEEDGHAVKAIELK